MKPIYQVYDHLQKLPEHLVLEVLEFIYTLEKNQTPSICRKPGSAKADLVKITDDFNAPLEDFKDYL